MTVPTTQKPILVVLTNASMLGREQPGHGQPVREQPGHGRMEDEETQWTEEELRHRTGFDIKEVAFIWLKLHKKMNAKIVFATPRGGEAPVDPLSMREAEKEEDIRDLIRDHSLVDTLKNTKSLDQVRADEFSLLLLPGCHGAMVDLPNCPKLAEIISTVYENNGYIATIGHGAAALLNVKTKSNQNEYLIKGKKMTAFTNEEEREKNFEKLIPYSLEDKLKERGAKFEKGKPFQTYVTEDERLITAQSSYSVKDWLTKIIQKAGGGSGTGERF